MPGAFSRGAARLRVEQLVRQFFTEQQPWRIAERYVLPLLRALNWDVDGAELVALGGRGAPDYLLRTPGPARMIRRLFVHTGTARTAYLYAYSTLCDTDRPEHRVRLALVAGLDSLDVRLFDCADPDPLRADAVHYADAVDAAGLVMHPYIVDTLAPRVIPGYDWTCIDLIERFDDLWDTFERDRVANGSLAGLGLARPGPPADGLLTGDLRRFRVLLAQGIVDCDPTIGDAAVTAAALQLLGWILLLKAWYDRGLTRDWLAELLRRLGGRTGGVALDEVAPEVFADGLLPRFDGPSRISVDPRRLCEVLTALVPGREVYTLAAMPVESVAVAHERLLGGGLRRVEGTITEVDKPEVRRAGGVYYTPRAIAEEIVERTVGRALAGCSGPEDVARLKVVDPACGAGIFLLVAYERILAWYRGELGARPTRAIRREILINNLFGVDIDDQAVGVARLGLAMKELEDVRYAELDGVGITDTSANIRGGNALIGVDLPADVSAAERLAARPFEWGREFAGVMAGGFDVVIGNPPYDVLEKDRGAASWPHGVLQRYVEAVAHGLRPALGGKRNLFRFFVVRGIEVLREGGYFGMIVPLSLLADVSTRGTRRYMLGRLAALEADCFPQKDNAARRVFRGAKLSTAVIVGRKAATVPADQPMRVRTYPWDSYDDAPLRSCEVVRGDLAALGPDRLAVPMVDDEMMRLCVRLHRHARVRRLGDIAEFELRRGEVNQTTYKRFIAADPQLARLLRGAEVAAYRLQAASQGERAWLDAAGCLAELVQGGTRDEWRGLAEGRRIATQRISGVDDARRLIAAIVEPTCYFADSTNSIASRGGSLEYLVALLNSRLWQWRFRLTSTNNNVQTGELAALPFRVIDRGDPGEVAIEAEIAALVRALGEAADPRAERRIDELVFELYGVTADERALIERTARVSG